MRRRDILACRQLTSHGCVRIRRIAVVIVANTGASPSRRGLDPWICEGDAGTSAPSGFKVDAACDERRGVGEQIVERSASTRRARRTNGKKPTIDRRCRRALVIARPTRRARDRTPISGSRSFFHATNGSPFLSLQSFPRRKLPRPSCRVSLRNFRQEHPAENVTRNCHLGRVSIGANSEVLYFLRVRRADRMMAGRQGFEPR